MFHVVLDSNAAKKEFDAATVAIAMDKVKAELPQAELLDREASQRRWPAKAQEYWNAHLNMVGLIANGDEHAGCIVNRPLAVAGGKVAVKKIGEARRRRAEHPAAGGKGSGTGGAGRG